MSVAKSVVRVAPLLLLMLSAVAEGRFCIGGNIEQMNPAAVQICQQDLRQLRAVAQQQNSPDWHYVLVCDEQGWRDYAAFSDNGPETLQNAAFDTNLSQRTTFVRGSRLHGALNQMFSAEVARIVRQSSIQMASNR